MSEVTKEVIKVAAPMNGGTPRVPSLIERIAEAEKEHVLANFAMLKERAASGRDGEMRVAVRRNHETGVVEMIHCGVGDKADLGSLRSLYVKLRQGVKF